MSRNAKVVVAVILVSSVKFQEWKWLTRTNHSFLRSSIWNIRNPSEKISFKRWVVLWKDQKYAQLKIDIWSDEKHWSALNLRLAWRQTALQPGPGRSRQVKWPSQKKVHPNCCSFNSAHRNYFLGKLLAGRNWDVGYTSLSLCLKIYQQSSTSMTYTASYVRVRLTKRMKNSQILKYLRLMPRKESRWCLLMSPAT